MVMGSSLEIAVSAYDILSGTSPESLGAVVSEAESSDRENVLYKTKFFGIVLRILGGQPMSDHTDGLKDDIVFMRGLAEQGRRGPVLGGIFLVAAGLILPT